MTRSAVVLFAFALLFASAAQADDPPLRIGTITIRNLDVYSDEEAQHGWVYRGANALHMQTRKAEIRRFLLFNEGDVYEPAILAESERNLRALRSLKGALVRALPPHDGVVDVEVVTQDSWSTEPGVSFGSRGGTSTWGVELSESNFLGLGRELALIYDKGIDRTKSGFIYRDPSFIRPYWKAELQYSSNSDGDESHVRLERNFYSFLTKWAVGTNFDDSTLTRKLYAASRVSSEFEQSHRSLTLMGGMALHASTDDAHRLSAGIDFVEDDFTASASTTELPDNRNFRYFFAQYDFVQNDFLKLNFINRDVRYEDINLGLNLSLRAGVSPSSGDIDTTTGKVDFRLSHGWPATSRSFVLPSVSAESRFDGGPENSIVRSSVLYTYRFESAWPQTFVSRIAFTRGWNLDGDVQFFADGQTGLRGYRTYAFEGDKSLMLNLEHRFFLGREIFQLISPGAAIFFDIGDAAPPGVPLSLSRMKKDAGIGLRIGLPRTPKNMLRIDFAWAFDEDPRGDRGMLISVSSSQAF